MNKKSIKNLHLPLAIPSGLKAHFVELKVKALPQPGGQRVAPVEK